MPKFLRYTTLALVVPTIVAASVYYFRLDRFNAGLKTTFIRQELSFPYYFKPGKGDYRLILGDINGLNFQANDKALGMLDRKQPNENSLIVVPSILPDNINIDFQEMTNEDYFTQIANSRGVVIADNICTDNWEENKNKEIYTHSRLSPGSFCFSEEESRDLDAVIKQFGVKKITILYDSDNYVLFIDNFLKYLDGYGIKYELIKSENFEGI